LGGRSRLRLPAPRTDTCLTKLIIARRSIRRFQDKPLTLNTLSQILWATYGFTTGRRRAVPSAGALYPLDVYVAVRRGGVEGVEAGLYYYNPNHHELELTAAGDFSEKLYNACLRQGSVRSAPVNVILVGVPERIRVWYGERGLQYMILEAGHAGQNIYLAATELGLGTVAIGAFDDEAVKEILGLRGDVTPLYIFPVGYPG
jgi:SagB-type dehydrogenase family enzyme